ncbi:hypothetical protein L6164_033601 [Bauhinia variegata]|uniref:Uncharacterized protein n=1 Tax=Bauhinia variegata TaxID=167791 RepID=A0ACB9KS68_BAUVA|nr:hypothetical protein L6164_033601 [Bauhinia variegata]
MGTCCGERMENKEMVTGSSMEDHKWSGKVMEANEGLNTVECLRGRLLAERQASRLAKEKEEYMGNKLIELESKLREEIKLREKYERKLKFLKKKLESFNITSISGESEQSYSSEKRENSCRSSTSSTTSRDPKENETKSHATSAAASENSTGYVSEASVSILNHTSPCIAKDSDSQVTDDSSYSSNPNSSSDDVKKDENRLSCSSSKSSAEVSDSQVTGDYISNLNPIHFSTENLFHNQNPSSKELNNDENRVSSFSSKSSVTVTDSEGDDGDFVDNSLAIVPMDLGSRKQANNPKPVNQSVIEVLDALRYARERLLGSTGTRKMTKVGS